MSKLDLQTRPIFHRSEQAIRSHVLVSFMALMMGKYLEIGDQNRHLHQADSHTTVESP